MTTERKITGFIILAMLVIIILQRQCGVDKNCPKVTSDTITVVQTVRDTFHTKSPTVIEIRPFRDTITLSRTDTLKIVETFLDTTFYGQTFEDSNLTAIVSGIVTRNQLIDLGLTYEFNKTTTTITNTTERPNRLKIFLGGSAGWGGNLDMTIKEAAKGFSLSPSLAILTKKDNLYTVSSDVFSAQPNASVAALWKFGKR